MGDPSWALLRIAQIEAGTLREGFADLDLASLTASVEEAFAPSAEDGKAPRARATAVHVLGDREPRTQMLANLVENGTRHTPGNADRGDGRAQALGGAGSV